MNSFTSSSDVNRRYVKGLAALVVIPASLLFGLGIYLQPLYGDLTRLGGYAERDFGPNKPLQEFAKPLYASGIYSGYKDMIVVGDSFSRMWPNHQWQNYLVVETGWSVQTINIDDVPLHQLVNSQAFRNAPPRLLVYESVERYLPERINDGQTCTPKTLPQPSKSIGPTPMDQGKVATALTKFNTRDRDWRDVKLSFSVKYLVSTARRELTGSDQTEVKKVALTSSKLFSSRNPNALLVYKEDIDKAGDWRASNVADMACRVERLRQLVESNGKTRFVMMIAPNKLTAYASVLNDAKLSTLSQLDKLADKHPVIVRTDRALVSAIQAGEQDVYLPDDTHWGTRGHQIAAETLLSFLRPPATAQLPMIQP